MKGPGKQAREAASAVPRNSAGGGGSEAGRGGTGAGHGGGGGGARGVGPGSSGGGGDGGEGLRRLIAEAARRRGVTRETVERDYAAGYLLASISRHERLQGELALKGGGALKKLLFEDEYRFSEDLDYSALETSGPGPLDEQELEEAMQTVASRTEEDLGGAHPGAGHYFEVSAQRYVEKRAHPGDQAAFVFRFKFPWHRRPTRPLKVEITRTEVVALPTRTMPLRHAYPPGEASSPASGSRAGGEAGGEAGGGPGGTPVRTYRTEEMVSEKLLALLGAREHLHARGWTNGRSARDYYDLWRIHGRYGAEMRWGEVREALGEKAERRGLAVGPVSGFFPEDLLDETRIHWGRRLGPVVPGGAPSLERVVPELRRALSEALGGNL